MSCHWVANVRYSCWPRWMLQTSQRTSHHLVNPLLCFFFFFYKDTQIMSTDCLTSVGAKSLHYPVGCAGYWRSWMVKAKAKGRMLLQKVILIDKAPCRLACGLLPPPPQWCVCCGIPDCCPEGPEQQRQPEKDSEINDCLKQGSYMFFPII